MTWDADGSDYQLTIPVDDAPRDTGETEVQKWTKVKTFIDDAVAEIESAKSDIVTNAGDIATNAAAIATNASDITAVEGDISTAETNIAANAAELSDFSTRLSAVESRSYRQVSLPATVLQSDFTVDATTGGTLTLPAASTVTGQLFALVCSTDGDPALGNRVTVQSTGSEEIRFTGSSAFYLSGYGAVLIQSDGTDWQILSTNAPETIPVDPPSEDIADLPATVPSGFTLYHSEDFESATAWLKTGGGYFGIYTGRQGGDGVNDSLNTRSRNLVSNVYTDTDAETGSGILRLRTAAEAHSSGTLYTSGYVGTTTGLGGTFSNSYFPLFGFYEFMIRYPVTHAHWNCIWLNYRGSAGQFEIDLAEIFTAQTPGKASFVIHSQRGEYGGKLNNNPNKGTMEWFVNDYSSSFGGSIAATRSGSSVDIADPFTAGQHTPWFKVGCKLIKVLPTSGSGWTLAIEYYLDDILVGRWTDDVLVDYQNGEVPHYYVPGDDDHSWDIRFDSWVGGDYIGQVEGNSLGEEPRVLTYNGRNGFNNTDFMAPVGTVPNTELWLADPNAGQVPEVDLSAEYFYDIAWYRVMVPDGSTPPPDPLSYLWEFDDTGSSGSAVVPVPGATLDQGVATTTNVPANTTVTWDTGQYVSLPNSVRVTMSGASGANLAIDDSASAGWDDIWMSCKFRVSALPASNGYIVFASPSGGGTSLAQIRLTPAGAIVLRDQFNDPGSGGEIASANGIINFGTWYRLDWMIQAGSTNNMTLRIQDVAGTQHSIPIELNLQYLSATLPGQFLWGFSGSAENMSIWFDDLILSDDGWIGGGDN